MGGWSHIPVVNGKYVIHPSPPARPNGESYAVEATHIYWDLVYVVYRVDTGVRIGDSNKAKTAEEEADELLADALGGMNMGTG